MRFLCELAGNPEKYSPSIHIAGSKGKGSITAMISAILEAGGFRVGRYMSPHVSDVRERLCLGNAFFDESIYCEAGDELRDLTENLLPDQKNSLFDPAFEGGEEPTYFELLTLYFFLCVRRAGCDIMVVETGMGGRLDCTNVVDPLVSVISLIELEHTKYLGNTIEEIAGEKAGIIKPGKPVVLAEQSSVVLELFRKKAEEKQSPLIYFPQTAEVDELQINKEGTRFTLCFKDGAPPLRLSIPVSGAVQAENAALSIIALKTAIPGKLAPRPRTEGSEASVPLCIKEEAFYKGLANFRLPARFEHVSEYPPIVIDGAHTPESIAHCAETFSFLYGDGNILIFGCAADKNAAAMAQILLPHFSLIIITTPGTFKTSYPDKVLEAFCPASGQNAKAILLKETGEALDKALECGREKGLAILCAGSFYLAAEIRNALKKDGNSSKDSSQKKKGMV